MQTYWNGRAVLLASVSAVVLCGPTPSSADPLTGASGKTPDIIAPEPIKSKQTAEKFTPRVTRSVTTRTIITSGGTTTEVIETSSGSKTPAVTETPRTEAAGLLSKPVDEPIPAPKAPKSTKRSKT